MNKSRRKPPAIASWLLNRILSPYSEYPALGDLEEEYYLVQEEESSGRAILWYWSQVLKSILPFFRNFLQWSAAMFKNYFKITYRNLIKYKSYSLINIFGLALGIACCLLILTFVLDEYSYDRFHEESDNIYRVAFYATISGRELQMPNSPPMLAPTLMKDYPEVISAVRFKASGDVILANEEIKITDNRFFYVDKTFFEIFSFEMIKGDPETALETANTLVITEETAKKLFGNEDSIGKIVKVNSSTDYTVTGIVKSAPENSHFHFEVLASMETLIKRNPEDFNLWVGYTYPTYILFQQGYDYRKFNSKLNEIEETRINPIIKQDGAEMDLYLQPLTDIHLRSNLMGELGTNGSIGIVYAFSSMAIFILLIACINFMNLSTARAANRAKEVGVRKVLGAFRKQLTKQFFFETFVITTIALFIALLLVEFALPLFNDLSGKVIDINYMETPVLIVGLILIVCFVGIAAGIYPAIMLSSFKPAAVLKGRLAQGSKNSKFRSVLVTFQFFITVFLIIGSTVIFKQIDFLKNKNLGFNKEQILALGLPGTVAEKSFESFKAEMLNINGVIKAGGSNSVPGGTGFHADGFFPEGLSHGQAYLMNQFNIEPGFLETYGIELIMGRSFSKDIPTDVDNSILINETAAKKFAWGDPIGKTIGEITDITDLAKMHKRTVIGVVKDFHIESLHSEVQPLHMFYSTNRSYYLSLKLSTVDLLNTMNLIEQKWNELLPEVTFTYFFVDESFDRRYRSEEKLSSIFQLFTFLAIMIGCLGLFGLASFTAEQRKKEIGIRKILGSEIGTIVQLMTAGFVKLILIANLLAWPVAYIALKQWLSSFPYHADIGIEVFVFAGILAMTIGLITVMYQSIRAAYTNPIDALRYE